jgi:hypothetical protein
VLSSPSPSPSQQGETIGGGYLFPGLAISHLYPPIDDDDDDDDDMVPNMSASGLPWPGCSLCCTMMDEERIVEWSFVRERKVWMDGWTDGWMDGWMDE